MKNIYLVFFFALLISGCYSYREYPVEYDYSYHGKFKKYKTFSFMVNQSMDETMSNAVIQSAITRRLELQGYREKKDKPNLLVSYRVYYDSLIFRGYDQPDIEKWVKSQRLDQEYDPKHYDLKKGTLLIQLFDRKQERSVWQGYATGVYGNIYFDNERQLKVAVRSILDRYQFLAEDFLQDKEFVVTEQVNNE